MPVNSIIGTKQLEFKNTLFISFFLKLPYFTFCLSCALDHDFRCSLIVIKKIVLWEKCVLCIHIIDIN